MVTTSRDYLSDRPLFLVLGGLLLLVLGLCGGVFFDRYALADQETKELIAEVTTGPRMGVVISNVDEEICLSLLNEEGEADNRKSCTRADLVFNLTSPAYGQPAAEVDLGRVYEVHRQKDFGVSDGLTFNTVSELPTPAPTIAPEATATPTGKEN